MVSSSYRTVNLCSAGHTQILSWVRDGAGFGSNTLAFAPGDHDKKALRKTKAAYCFVATTRPSAFRNTR